MSKQKIAAFDWGLWFQWIMATTLGWLLGKFLLPGAAVVADGFGIGIAQWVILDRRIDRSWRWILASAIGWSAGWVINLSKIPEGMGFVEGLVVGTTLGIAQWIVLREELHWAGWWIPINIVAWSTALGLTPGFLLTGITAGLVTGFAIELLLRNPRPRKPETGVTGRPFHGGE